MCVMNRGRDTGRVSIGDSPFRCDGLELQVHEESASGNDAVDNPSRKKNSVDVSKVLEPLEGECATVSHLFWSYKWCHRGSITQASSRPRSSSKGSVTELQREVRIEITVRTLEWLLLHSNSIYLGSKIFFF